MHNPADGRSSPFAEGVQNTGTADGHRLLVGAARLAVGEQIGAVLEDGQLVQDGLTRPAKVGAPGAVGAGGLEQVAWDPCRVLLQLEDGGTHPVGATVAGAAGVAPEVVAPVVAVVPQFVMLAPVVVGLLLHVLAQVGLQERTTFIYQ